MKDVVNTKEIELLESPPSPEPDRRWAGVIFERNTTPTINLDAGIVILPVGQEQHKGGKNAHEAEEIYYVVRGKGQFVLGERVVDVEKGTAVYVAPMVNHRAINTGDEEMELYWVLNTSVGTYPFPAGGFLGFLKDRGWKRVR